MGIQESGRSETAKIRQQARKIKAAKGDPWLLLWLSTFMERFQALFCYALAVAKTFSRAFSRLL